MTLRVDRGHLCVTPDGPRGPRRSVHQGVAYMASRTGFPIVGAGMAFKRPWRAKSWDKFCVPRPFSPAACVVPPPVVVPHDADRETIEDCRREVEHRMQSAMIEAEDWVEDLFVFPSCGDESNAVGAAYLAYLAFLTYAI